MKKLLSALLVMMMLVACMAPALADEGSEPDWTHYDELIAEIKSTTDVVAREALMHEAEDMLMETGRHPADLLQQRPVHAGFRCDQHLQQPLRLQVLHVCRQGR